MPRKRGLLIYNKEEKEINKAFIKMLIDAANKREIDLRYLDKEEALEKPFEVDFIINRTRDYKVAEQYEKRKILAFNSSFINRIGNDKYLTYQEIEKLHIPYLPLVGESDYPYVLKSRSGHGGKEVFLIKNKEDLQIAKTKLKDQAYLCQSIAQTLGKDLRVYVMGGKIIQALLRDGNGDFRSNYGLHGKASIYNLNKEEEALVFKIIKALKPDYAGIDFLFHQNKLVFNEIEDVVGARMLYEQTNLNIADLYLEYIGGKIHDIRS